MVDFTLLAASVVNVLRPVLEKGIERGIEKAGEETTKTLFGVLKKKLHRPGAVDALDELAQNPGDADNQAALRVQLRKALQDDPALAAELREWIDSASSAASVQTATANDGSTVTQVQGSYNTVR